MNKTQISNPLNEALTNCRKVFIVTFMFAFGVNLLMLLTPLYSLQVLDKVISSHSLETLTMLTLVMLVIHIAYTLLQIARSFTLIKVGEWLDTKLTPILFANSVSISAIRTSLGASQNLRDLETVKGFLTSIGINTLFDAPWSIIYLIVIFLIHPYLGYLTIIGGIIILLFAVLNAYATNSKLNQANEYNMKSLNLSEIATRNAEVVEAMGMMKAVVHNWHKANLDKLNMQSIASYRNGIISNISKLLRMVLQMAVTGIGAYVVIKHPDQMTVGGMIASSILVGRALAPFDAAIETWKQITGASKAYERLKDSFERSPLRQEAMSLPTPEGRLSVENLLFAPPATAPQATPRYTLKGVSFALEPGEILAVIGPSAAGKSSLAKLIVGVWKPMSGIVRLDGADVYTWNRDDFGKHIGYLPQGIELFSGSIKENIARLREDATPEQIVDAAKLSGAHDMILRLPNGYETDIGISGSAISAGQRQRVGLARAYFGNPKLVVLDEPNANLDELGEQALVSALVNAKERKITSIIISHRPSILSCVDKILILQDGMVAAFGPRDEVLSRFSAPRPTQPN
ncbi:MAG: type I secretion system permease/ATPase [Alphaproteobacteria bacterium]